MTICPFASHFYLGAVQLIISLSKNIQTLSQKNSWTKCKIRRDQLGCACSLCGLCSNCWLWLVFALSVVFVRLDISFVCSKAGTGIIEPLNLTIFNFLNFFDFNYFTVGTLFIDFISFIMQKMKNKTKISAYHLHIHFSFLVCFDEMIPSR